LDAGGARYSQDLSEVDLSDLDDLKVRVNDPAGDVLVHLGASDYLRRYGIYVGHVKEWRQQFQKLDSVDLRYDNQIIVNPDMPGTKQVALNPASFKAATSSGVKQAALITRIGPHDKAVPKPAFELTPKSLDAAGAAKKPAAKTGKGPVKKTVVKGKAGAASRKVHAKKANASGAHKIAAAQKPAAGKSGQPSVKAPAASALPKPSPAIAKQQENMQ
jgi:hypothetical protein